MRCGLSIKFCDHVTYINVECFNVSTTGMIVQIQHTAAREDIEQCQSEMSLYQQPDVRSSFFRYDISILCIHMHIGIKKQSVHGVERTESS